MRVVPRFLVFAIIALVVLTACAQPDDPGNHPDSTETESTPAPVETPEPFRGLPDGADGTVDSPAGVVIGADRLVLVVTYGSSSNPAVVHGVTAEGQEVTVDVHADEGRPATMDYVPTTSGFVLPEGVDTAEPVTFALGKFGSVTLETAESGAQGWVERAE